MSENQYLARVPLLDPKQQVIGYKLAWQRNGARGEPSSEAELRQLLAFVAERVGNSELGLLFLEASPAVLSAQALQIMPPQTTVLMLKQDDLLDADNATLVASLREQGFGLALHDADPAFLASNEALLSLVTRVQLVAGHPDLAAISKLGKYRKPPFSVVVDQCPDWPAFDACASLGLNGFFQNLCIKPHKLGLTKEMSLQTVLILQLMQMVQENADVRHLEKILQRDATLSYKLFQYINSARFGMEVEVQSLRHAVTMLGYKPLFRWLSLLLATTSTTGFSPALLKTAIVRGRFAELLGQGLLSRSEAENLFLVGMFSLLDQLLGIPIEAILSEILLPETIAQALLSREGVYGPFLALTEACEQADGCASDIADGLFMTTTRVNQAHVSALAWAQSLKL